ncbi:UNVERIFIED_CONTAM: hypothetical protein Sindi_0515900 [Sesamum indicum]
MIRSATLAVPTKSCMMEGFTSKLSRDLLLSMYLKITMMYEAKDDRDEQPPQVQSGFNKFKIQPPQNGQPKTLQKPLCKSTSVCKCKRFKLSDN